MGTIARYFMICLATALVGWSCSNDETPPPSPPQPPLPPITYDIDIAATRSLGVHFEVEGDLTCYFLTLADIEIGGTADIPIPSGAGNLLVLDLYAKSKAEIMLPEGTYNYTAGDLGEFKFATTSKHLRTGVDTPVEDMNFFTEAQMTVTKKGNIYTIEVIGKVINENKLQRTLHTTYTGELKFDPYGNGGVGDDFFPRLDTNIETTFITSQVAYYGPNAKNGHRFDIELQDYTNSPNRVGRILRVQLFSPTAENMMPAPGTYTVAAIYNDFSTHAYSPGELQPGYINNATMQNKGTHLIDTRLDGGRTKDYYGIVTKGTVVVTQAGDQTTFTINFTDENKHSIKGSYTGKLSVRNRNFHSNLPSDHEIQLAGMPGHVTYHEKLYLDRGIDADSWVIQVTSGQNGSDALQLELLAPSSAFANGVPAGTYTLKSDYATGEYTALPGRLSLTSLLSSWYLGDMAGSMANIVAPLKTGKVTVTRSGTACTITIEALDDAPTAHKLTGSWTGTPVYKNNATQAKATAYIPTFRTALKGK